MNTTQSNMSHLLNSSGVLSNKNLDVTEIENYNGQGVLGGNNTQPINFSSHMKKNSLGTSDI